MHPSFTQLDRVLSLARQVHDHIQPRGQQPRPIRTLATRRRQQAHRCRASPNAAAHNRRADIWSDSDASPPRTSSPLPDLRQRLTNPIRPERAQAVAAKTRLWHPSLPPADVHHRRQPYDVLQLHRDPDVPLTAAGSTTRFRSSADPPHVTHWNPERSSR